MAKIWDVLFASAGDKQAIPVPVDPSGNVSVTQGWTPDYELPNTDPSYKPVGREEMNGAFNEVTESIQQLQLQGAAEWSSLLMPYPNGAHVIHSGQRWRSTAAGNTDEPGVGVLWVNTVVPAASTALPGIVELATNAESLAGTDTERAVTPAGIRAALSASGNAPIYASRAWVNFDGTGIVSIRGSGNVSSITDNAVGNYTVNYAVDMPDLLYSTQVTSGTTGLVNSYSSGLFEYTLSRVRILTTFTGGSNVLADPATVNVEITR